MAKIRIVDITEITKKAKLVKPVYSEDYKKLVEAADLRIELSKNDMKRAEINSQFYVARSNDMVYKKVK